VRIRKKAQVKKRKDASATADETSSVPGREPPFETSDPEVSRRHLMRSLGTAAAVGVGIAVTGEMLNPAPAAASSGPETFISQTSETALQGGAQGSGRAIVALVEGSTNGSAALHAETWGTGNAVFASIPGAFGTDNGFAALYALTRAKGIAVAAEIRNAANASPAVSSYTDGTGAAVYAEVDNNSNGSPAVWARTNGTGRAVLAEIVNPIDSSQALHAQTNGTGNAVRAQITNSNNPEPALYGFTVGTGRAALAEVFNASNASAALHGLTNGTGPAVRGEVTNAGNPESAILGLSNGSGPVVRGRATGTGNAMWAQVLNGGNVSPALRATTNGTGPAVQAEITNAASPESAVFGLSDGSGPVVRGRTTGSGSAVWAQVLNGANASPALRATTNGTGVAIVADGGRAQLRLVPSAAIGAPTTGVHDKGEVFTDATGSLFHCKVGDGTNAGTWLRVGYNPIDPVRIVDTRPGGPPVSHGDLPLAHGDELLVQIINVAGIPVGASAVTVNVTAVGPTANGYMSLYPAHLNFSAGSPPSFSSVNLVGGPASAAVANQATVKIATIGPNPGWIKVFNFGGTSHVLLDVAGFYS
jgi:hypothetical protein